MAASSEMARLKRDIQALIEAVQIDGQGRQGGMTVQARRALRSDIEHCMQRLDELRGRLAG